VYYEFRYFASNSGADVKLVHPFESVFSDEAGADVIRSFTFAQESTNVKLLMDQSLHILQTTRSNDDTWQLQIVLSDGKCEDHEYIQSRVRAAAEERIAMVFIILDNRDKSIIDLETVEFDGGQMKITKYMESFPFDYFVVVKNVNKLPEVLAEVLRQFFAMVSN
jgi:midasin